MTSYIGTKVIEAEPEEKMLEGDNVSSAGYKVKYPDGYISWSPKEVFEKAYLSMGVGNTNKITKEMVDNFMYYRDVSMYEDKTTVVHMTLKNGYILSESSSCVDPDNYDEAVGVRICMERITNKVWELLGFLLQTAKSGIKPD